MTFFSQTVARINIFFRKFPAHPVSRFFYFFKKSTFISVRISNTGVIFFLTWGQTFQMTSLNLPSEGSHQNLLVERQLLQRLHTEFENFEVWSIWWIFLTFFPTGVSWRQKSSNETRKQNLQANSLQANSRSACQFGHKRKKEAQTLFAMLNILSLPQGIEIYESPKGTLGGNKNYIQNCYMYFVPSK